MDAKTAMMAATTALQFGAKISQARALKQQGEVEASLERRNAEAQEKQIGELKAQRDYEIDLINQDAESYTKQIEADYAYSGVVASRGTPLDMLVDSSRRFKNQIQALNYNTDIQINDAIVKRDNFLLRATQADLYYKRRANAMKFDAFATVVKGGTDLYGLGAFNKKETLGGSTKYKSQYMRGYSGAQSGGN
tara:strand:+ start:11655 stop:12233 length:579 start_codon:yes stop_codon:yes gene_type:complete